MSSGIQEMTRPRMRTGTRIHCVIAVKRERVTQVEKFFFVADEVILPACSRRCASLRLHASALPSLDRVDRTANVRAMCRCAFEWETFRRNSFSNFITWNMCLCVNVTHCLARPIATIPEHNGRLTSDVEIRNFSVVLGRNVIGVIIIKCCPTLSVVDTS